MPGRPGVGWSRTTFREHREGKNLDSVHSVRTHSSYTLHGATDASSPLPPKTDKIEKGTAATAEALGALVPEGPAWRPPYGDNQQ